MGKKGRILSVLAAVLLILFCAFYTESQLLGIPQATLCLPEQTVITDSFSARGLLEPDSTAEIKPSLPLIAKEIFVRTGQQVAKGDRLFSVDKASTLLSYVSLLTDNGVSAADSLQTVAKKLKKAAGGSWQQLEPLLQSQAEQLSLSGTETLGELLTQAVALLPEAYYAPVDGEITAVSVYYTRLSEPEQPVVSIGNCNRRVVKLHLPAEQAARLKTGQTVSLTADGTEQKADGLILRIAKEAESAFSLLGETPKTGVVVLPKEAISAGDGTSVTVRFPVGAARTALILPYEAVFQEEQKEYVFVWTKDGCRPAEIKTGTELARGVEIRAGLHADSVVCLLQGKELPRQVRLVEGTK